jgi:hypothetical protein
MFEVTVLLSCQHINYVHIESVVSLPSVGENKLCSRCKTKKEIVKVGVPYRMGETAPNPAIDHKEKDKKEIGTG